MPDIIRSAGATVPCRGMSRGRPSFRIGRHACLRRRSAAQRAFHQPAAPFQETFLRLRQIKLAGFKSFADPALIELEHPVVGIVGPNGCGKSNIIDAVRWVARRGARL